MMIRLMLVCLVVGLTMGRFDDWNPNRCWTSGNGQSVRWWDEYSQITRGRYWYECRNGKLEPKGCIDRQQRKLRIGETFERDHYEMTCVKNFDGYMTFKMTACLPKFGGRFTPGQKYNEPQNRYWYECQQRQYSLMMRVGGCNTDLGEKVKIGQKRIMGKSWYQCRYKWDRTASLSVIGCVYNGNTYKIGESWSEGEYVWYCKRDGDKTKKLCIGCMNGNSRLNDGQEYYKDDMIIKCIIAPDARYHRAIGCVQRDRYGTVNERVLGCRWTEQDYLGKYEMGCDLEGDKAMKTPIGCVWIKDGIDYLSVPPNTYTIWFDGKDNRAIGCRYYIIISLFLYSYMMFLYVLFLFCLSVSWAIPRRSCIGGHRHGSQVDMGQFWYFCGDGKLENKGCFAQNRKRIRIGETNVADGLMTQCLDEYGTLRLENVGCVVDGDIHGPNQFWNDPRTNLWYFCEQLTNTLRLNFGGCVMEGDRVAKNRHVVRKDVIYKCFDQMSNQSPGLKPVGCMHYAKRYNLGNVFNESGFSFSCKEHNGSAIKQPIGCIHNGQRISPGERYMKDDAIYECQIAPEARHLPVGCVRQLGAQKYSRDYRLIGERWTQGHSPYKYEVECQSNKDKTVVQPVACVYVDSYEKEISIEVGCMKLIDKYLIACKRRQKDDMIMFAILDAHYADRANFLGVKYCGPKTS